MAIKLKEQTAYANARMVVFKKGKHQGKVMSVVIQKFTGRRFKPGKDDKGRFLDIVGEPDNRIAVMNTQGQNEVYEIVNNETELNELIDENIPASV